MADEKAVKSLVKTLSKVGVLVAADVKPESLEGFSIDDIASRIIERRISNSSMSIVNNIDIKNIIDEIRLEKAPKPIEVIQKPEYKAYASEIDANYNISNN